MKKKAMSITFLLAVIVLAVTLAIIIYAFSQLNAEKNIDKQACRISVDARSTLNFGKLLEPGKDFIPLNCKTEKICISSSGDDCDATGFTPSKNNKVTKNKVGITKTTREVVLDSLANALYDCHYEVGEGQRNFLPSKTFSQNYCAICSHIVLDEKARQEVGEISYMELYQYMQRTPSPNGESYLKFVYGIENANEMLITLTQVTQAIKEKDGTEIPPNNLKINLNYKEGNAVIAQLSTQSTFPAWASLISTATGVVVIGVGIIGSPFTLGGSTALIGVGFLTIGKGTYQLSNEIGTSLGDGSQILVSGPILVSQTPDGATYGRPTFYAYDAKVLNSLNCNSFEFAP